MLNNCHEQETLVNGVGIRLVLLQWVLAANIVAFTLKWFLASLILTSISLALLVWIHITLYLHPVASTRPLDTLFIHAPLRLLLISIFLQAFPQVLFITLGWHYNLVKDESDFDKWSWQAVAFIVSFNAAGLVEVAWRLDFVWAVGGMWIVLGQLTQRPKAANVFVRTSLPSLSSYLVPALVSFRRSSRRTPRALPFSFDPVRSRSVDPRSSLMNSMTHSSPDAHHLCFPFNPTEPSVQQCLPPHCPAPAASFPDEQPTCYRLRTQALDSTILLLLRVLVPLPEPRNLRLLLRQIRIIQPTGSGSILIVRRKTDGALGFQGALLVDAAPDEDHADEYDWVEDRECY